MRGHGRPDRDAMLSVSVLSSPGLLFILGL